MRIRSRFFVVTLGVGIAIASRTESASALSDRVLITASIGFVVFDGSVDEGGAAAPELSLSFGATLDPLDQTNSIVVLSEPAGEPPGESPIFIPGTELVLSDLVIANTFQGVNLGLLFLSDGDPTLAQILPILETQPFAIVEETGELQDISALLGTGGVNLKVEVQSDVVPEPGTLLLVGGGLLGFAAHGRRRRS